ncbi:ribosome small subunit-dependent GTPase A [Leptospira mayottensis]|uniref:Small ribosomal subunit biogenesis GTPase RsgA n=2 Tax=Leptospira mayottensis TaxID=1137606 RepID=A0AA87SZC4_9LEPT|nr:ribosome small subunit-dependent GTPase A [Leptospira mayottensis]AXR59745.1 ribosome small subunit-dependent GTPase A [Leptospira mayottensis]AXR64009.1 ribosome small subunit-dependent GTPase A [Leptospira mayottensis]AZQ00935.1 ribosome small subunit-dependent GTPase A [Leptospira mayottensis 200901116]EKS00532.1 ribosome small subunit-dependent GTPase A [Leptospira mayottensis 200901122]TGN02593.1 ribosome small subunit-dependent GTPase A [Leptospira mayottensis]
MSQLNPILTSYGWEPETFLTESIENLKPGRVISVYGEHSKILTEFGERKGIPSGTLMSSGEFIVTGDWVLVREIDGEDLCIVEKILPRKTFLRRKNPGKRKSFQAIASNIDLLLVIMGLDSDYSPRRIERYLFLAKISGVTTAIILNKKDLCEHSEQRFSEIKTIAGEIPVEMISALNPTYAPKILRLIKPGNTIAFLGSSGAGKSTIINSLLGVYAQKTNEVKSSDGTGKHTTTHRELFLLPSGGILMDNPGIREVGLFSESGEEDLEEIFPEIATAAQECRFKDCSHNGEPDCGVAAALKVGKIDEARYSSYLKLTKELQAHKVSIDSEEARKKKQKDKQLSKALRKRLKDKGKI